MTLKTRVRQVARTIVGSSALEEPKLICDLLGSEPGVMLDVGAHSGMSLKPFADAGWKVHAFEPDPANREALIGNHGTQSNVTIVPAAVSDRPGVLPLYISPESSGISTLAPFTSTHEPTVTVPVLTLSDYLTEQAIDGIDFLKIDVEGFERHVLDGLRWQVVPRAIVLEFEDQKTRPLGYSWTDLADLLIDRGYEVTVSEWAPIERYGVPHHWSRFASYPAELLHDASWGNLIALQPSAGDLQPILRAAERRYRRRARLDRLRGAKPS